MCICSALSKVQVRCKEPQFSSATTCGQFAALACIIVFKRGRRSSNVDVRTCSGAELDLAWKAQMGASPKQNRISLNMQQSHNTRTWNRARRYCILIDNASRKIILLAARVERVVAISLSECRSSARVNSRTGSPPMAECRALSDLMFGSSTHRADSKEVRCRPVGGAFVRRDRRDRDHARVQFI
jgi:hypothetical protein